MYLRHLVLPGKRLDGVARSGHACIPLKEGQQDGWCVTVQATGGYLNIPIIIAQADFHLPRSTTLFELTV